MGFWTIIEMGYNSSPNFMSLRICAYSCSRIFLKGNKRGAAGRKKFKNYLEMISIENSVV
jgi:hypothetical protein